MLPSSWKHEIDRTRGRTGRDGGFSLLEVVLAIALVTSMALAISLLLVSLSRQARIGRETQSANLAAKRVLEMFQATPFNEIIPSYPEGTELEVPELPNGKVVVQYEDPEADPLLASVTVAWSSSDLGAMSRTFNTVRTE